MKAQGGQVESVQNNGYGFHQGRMVETYGIRQSIQDMLWDRNVFSKGTMPAVVRTRNAQDLTVVTQVVKPLSRVPVIHRIHGGIEGDPVAFRPVCNPVSNFGNHTGGLMPHNQRRDAPTCASVHAMYIAPANTTGLHLYQYILRAQVRCGNLFISEPVIFFENQGFHFILAPIAVDT